MKFMNMEVNAEISGVHTLNEDGSKSMSIPIRVHVGDVGPNEYGVKGVSHSVTFAPIVEFEDGKMVIIPWDSLIDMAINIKQKYEAGECEEESK